MCCEVWRLFWQMQSGVRAAFSLYKWDCRPRCPVGSLEVVFCLGFLGYALTIHGKLITVGMYLIVGKLIIVDVIYCWKMSNCRYYIL